jgi:hypothetical protein
MVAIKAADVARFVARLPLKASRRDKLCDMVFPHRHRMLSMSPMPVLS